MRGLPEPARWLRLPCRVLRGTFSRTIPPSTDCLPPRRRAISHCLPRSLGKPSNRKTGCRGFGRIGPLMLFKPRKGVTGRIRTQSVRGMKPFGIDAVDFETVPEIIGVADVMYWQNGCPASAQQYIVRASFREAKGMALRADGVSSPQRMARSTAQALPLRIPSFRGRGLFAVDFQRHIPKRAARPCTCGQGLASVSASATSHQGAARPRPFFRIELHPYKPDAFFGLVRKHLS